MSFMANEPLSWLTLERYALDELTSAERAAVEQRLAKSREDRACLDSILADASELPPLPLPTAVDRPAVASLEQARKKRHGWAWITTSVAAAAALLLTVLRPHALPPASRVVSYGTKGGEVALQLLSERLGERPDHFVPGDRFKLMVTCPSWLGRGLRVVVFQEGQRYQPLAPVEAFACGNLVPWPGAFTLDGESPVEVCVTWAASSRVEVASSGGELSPEVVCEHIPAGSR